MTRVEYEKRINALQNELNSLKEKLSQIQDEIPNYPVFNNEESWAMNSVLEPHEYSMIKCNTNNNDINTDFNLFHKKYFAEEFAEKCRMIAMLLHCKWYLCPDYIADFSNDLKHKWIVYYNSTEKKFSVDAWVTRFESQVYFDTKENAQKAAGWMNEHFKFN